MKGDHGEDAATGKVSQERAFQGTKSMHCSSRWCDQAGNCEWSAGLVSCTCAPAKTKTKEGEGRSGKSVPVETLTSEPSDAIRVASSGEGKKR